MQIRTSKGYQQVKKLSNSFSVLPCSFFPEQVIAMKIIVHLDVIGEVNGVKVTKKGQVS